MQYYVLAKIKSILELLRLRVQNLWHKTLLELQLLNMMKLQTSIHETWKFNVKQSIHLKIISMYMHTAVNMLNDDTDTTVQTNLNNWLQVSSMNSESLELTDCWTPVL